jgi:hypothetical protein
MSFSQADIDAIDRAIATGELRVRFSAPGGSHREVEYRSMDDLIKAKREMMGSVQTVSGQPRRVPRYQLASFDE